MYFEDGLYYLIGEGKKVLGDNDISECFNLYSSPNLSAWTFVSCALKNEDIIAPMSGTPYYRMERPKIFKCPGQTTDPYRLVFHCDTPAFTMMSIGVLTAPSITGPFTFSSPCF